MLYLPTASNDATKLFALEYWLAQQDYPSTVFLLWSTRPTIMLGKYQDALAEVNLAFVERQKLQVTRRYSGGGTIYTDPGCFQYSFIAPATTAKIDFTQFSARICQALQQMGLPVQQSSRNDLTFQGRKFSGNAQYHRFGHVIHHGSLLFDTDVKTMAAALHVDNLKLRSKHIASVHQRVINLKTGLPTMTAAEFRARLLASIKQTADEVTPLTLTPTQWRAVDGIQQAIFANDKFIYQSTPLTEITKKRYFPGGGLVKLSLTVKHGVLTAFRLNGDFFSDVDVARLSQGLVGQRFRPATVQAQLTALLAATPIVNISAADLTALCFS